MGWYHFKHEWNIVEYVQTWVTYDLPLAVRDDPGALPNYRCCPGSQCVTTRAAVRRSLECSAMVTWQVVIKTWQFDKSKAWKFLSFFIASRWFWCSLKPIVGLRQCWTIARSLCSPPARHRAVRHQVTVHWSIWTIADRREQSLGRNWRTNPWSQRKLDVVECERLQW